MCIFLFLRKLRALQQQTKHRMLASVLRGSPLRTGEMQTLEPIIAAHPFFRDFEPQYLQLIERYDLNSCGARG